MYVDRSLRSAYDDAMKVINDCLGSIIVSNGYPISKVTVNNRLKTTHGRCFTNRMTMSSRIEIAGHMLKNEVAYDDLVQVMIHEILHSLKDCQCHTGRWKLYADIVTSKTKFNITRCTHVPNALDEDYKYIFVCENCGVVFKRTKASKFTKHPEYYKCGGCNGRIKRVK